MAEKSKQKILGIERQQKKKYKRLKIKKLMRKHSIGKKAATTMWEERRGK